MRAAALAVLIAGTAFAQTDSGFAQSASGFTAGPLIWNEAPASVPQWVDDDGGFVIVQPKANGFQYPQLECWDIKGASPVMLNVLAYYSTSNPAAFVPREHDFLIFAADGIYTGTCGDAGTMLSPTPPSGDFQSFGGLKPMLLEPDGGVLYLAAGGLAQIDPVTLNGQILVRATDLTDGGQALRDFEPTPGGGFVFMLSDRLVSRAADGTTSVRWVSSGGRSVLAPLAFHAASGFTLFASGTGSPTVSLDHLGALPVSGPRLADDAHPPWPRLPVYDGLVNELSEGTTVHSRSATLYALSGIGSASYGLRALSFDPDIADFDRDGLRASQEVAMGLDDFNPDVDSDGISDGLEVLRYATDPHSASSVPTVVGTGSRAVLAPSYHPTEWAGPPPDCNRDVGPEVTDLRCEVIAAELHCGDNLPVSCRTPAAMLHQFPVPVLFNRDHSRAYYAAYPPNTGWHFEDVATLAVTDLPAPASNGLGTLLPLDGDRALYFYGVNRTLISSAAPFDVYARLRTDCQLLGGPNDTTCGQPLTLWPGLTRVDVVGFQSGQLLVAVQSSEGISLLAYVNDTWKYMGDLSWILPAFVRQVLPVTNGGYAIGVEQDSFRDTLRTDEALRPLTTAQTVIDEPAGAPYRGAYLQRIAQHYTVEPLPMDHSGCEETEDFIICDQPPPFMLIDDIESSLAGWSAVEPVLLPGELIGAERSPWSLWHITTRGALAQWLDVDEFMALMPAAERATPGPVGALAVSPDSRHVCVAEPAAHRTWELILDSTGAPTSVRLADAMNGDGCAYDESGQLAVVGGSPAALHLGASTLPLAGLTQAAQVVRAGGQWLVRGANFSLYCLTDTGAAKRTGVTALAIAPAFGGVALVIDTAISVTTANALCSDDALLEDVLPGGGSVVEVLYDPHYTFRSIHMLGALLAVRDDGVMWLTPNFHLGLPGTQLQISAPGSFRLYPTYTPRDPSLRMTQLDPFRIKTLVSGLASQLFERPDALASVPGAPADTDWGYDGVRPGEPVGPPTVTDLPDAGMADAGMMPPPPPNAKPCGCTQAPGLALVALLALRSRRRR